MRLELLRKSASTAAVATALAAGSAVLVPTPAQATPVYWTFENTYGTNGGKCVTSGVLHNPHADVYYSACVSGDKYQQWDPLTNGALRNRATQQCLQVDNSHDVGNAVFASSCPSGTSAPAAQSFGWGGGEIWTGWVDINPAKFFYLVINDGQVRGDNGEAIANRSYDQWTGQTV
jgi:hypothetical protein